MLWIFFPKRRQVLLPLRSSHEHKAARRYAAVTGVRAILADQGQNDWPEDNAAKVFTNYVTWVEQARADLSFPGLAVVVNRASPPGGRPVIRRVQERMIREIPHCHPGPDYDLLLPSDRYDAVHFSASGLPLVPPSSGPTP